MPATLLNLRRARNPGFHAWFSSTALAMLVCAAVTGASAEEQPAQGAPDSALLSKVYPAPVQEVLEKRCMVCHGCYDAPCQLKMDAWAGLARGAHKKKVYDGTRLIPAQLTRLYEDSLDLKGWRGKGFYPVLGEGDPRQGLLYRMLALKEEYPLPAEGRLPDDFDFRLDRDQSCPSSGEFTDYLEKRPYQGMPYGFPGLDPERLHTLTEWLKQGAPGVAATPLSWAERQAVDRWEAFLNGRSMKEQLVSRYIFEHLFIASLYFDEQPGTRHWYTLVRSRTPPGERIELIATRRPYDPPGDGEFYYRLQRRHLTPLAKRHMPYRLNPARMRRWRELFLEPDYSVTSLPGYEGKDGANPFVIFEQLPVNSRYRFMLDEAHFTIMAYIKGPVCRGQVALNVIDDHFWVAFAQPNALDPEQSARFLARHAHEMRLPQPKGSLVVTLLQWRRYAKSQRRFLEAQAKAISRVIEQNAVGLDLDLIWDGDGGRNDNAALTIFRHIDSATVVKGFVGQNPKTMWIIDYSLLERIHYLLVAGFDVYGAVGHQLESRLYMDFLRMEGEQAFLLFLPEASRTDVRDYWYRGARDHVRNYLMSPKNARYERPTAISYRSGDPRSELMDMLKSHIPDASSARYRVELPLLQSLMAGSNAGFRFLPEVAFLQIIDAKGERRYYSLLHNQAFSNNAQLFQEEDRRLPAEDTLTVTRGFVGSYPNMYFQIVEHELPDFVASLRALADESDYITLVERYGVRRTAPWFWKLSDDMHREYAERFPAEAGLFDFNRYENR
jgi:hypothetical protein